MGGSSFLWWKALKAVLHFEIGYGLFLGFMVGLIYSWLALLNSYLFMDSNWNKDDFIVNNIAYSGKMLYTNM